MIEARSDKLAARWDPRKDFTAPGGEIDLGDIGEDAEGIFVRRHVLVVLHEEPLVEAWFAAWASCTDRTVRIEHHTSLCAWWIAASMIAAAAADREQLRRMPSAEGS